MRKILALLLFTAGITAQTVVVGPDQAGKANVGLGNVDNTSDADKPVSTAQQAALDLKAPLANPVFTGNLSVGTTVLPGNAYYADAINGHDYNDGLSPFSAVKTIAALSALDTASNKSTWCIAGAFREQLTVPRNNMTVGWCNWGTQPMLDGSDAVAASAWSLVAGKTNCYQATVPIAGLAGKTFVNAYENGGVLTRVASTSLCDSTASSTSVSSDVASGNITLYVHLAADANPGTKADGWVEYTRRQYGLDSRSVTGAQISGVWTRRNLHNDGSLILGVSGTANNVYTTDGNLHSIFLRTGATLHNFECYGRYNTTEDSYVAFNENTPASEGITIANGYIHSPASDVLADGIYGHNNTSGTFGAVNISNVNISNVNRGYHIDQSSGVVTITGGTLSGNYFNIRGESAGNPLTISGVTFSNVQTGGNNIAITGSGAVVNVDGVTTGNLTPFVGSATNLIVSITNSTFGDCADMIIMSNTGGTFTITGNTFGAITDAFFSMVATQTITSDNNTFKNPTGRGQYAFQVNGTNYTWAAWRAIPQDANSTAN